MAASAPSRAAILRSAMASVGLAYRVYIKALLLPSAQRFIPSLEENVNVEERTISAATGASTPWRKGSPAWIAEVENWRGSNLFFFMTLIIGLRGAPRQPPNWWRMRAWLFGVRRFVRM